MEAEKDIIKRDMKLKDTMIDQLKAQLREVEQRSKVYEAQLPDGERGLRQQIHNFQKNMDQLTVMYTNLASSQKLLTKDKKVVENKLQRVTDKYRELDSNYKVVREQCSQSQRTIKELYKLIQERLINRPDGDH